MEIVSKIILYYLYVLCRDKIPAVNEQFSEYKK